jgi:hypothetical protein
LSQALAFLDDLINMLRVGLFVRLGGGLSELALNNERETQNGESKPEMFSASSLGKSFLNRHRLKGQSHSTGEAAMLGRL